MAVRSLTICVTRLQDKCVNGQMSERMMDGMHHLAGNFGFRSSNFAASVLGRLVVIVQACVQGQIQGCRIHQEPQFSPVSGVQHLKRLSSCLITQGCWCSQRDGLALHQTTRVAACWASALEHLMSTRKLQSLCEDPNHYNCSLSGLKGGCGC